jgi:hypothetical protein
MMALWLSQVRVGIAGKRDDGKAVRDAVGNLFQQIRVDKQRAGAAVSQDVLRFQRLEVPVDRTTDGSVYG